MTNPFGRGCLRCVVVGQRRNRLLPGLLKETKKGRRESQTHAELAEVQWFRSRNKYCLKYCSTCEVSKNYLERLRHLA